jgi:hypothetical protein
MRKWMIGVAASALALGLAACSSPPTPVQTASSAAQKAADQFATLANGSGASGNVPRQTDAAAGPLLDTVFNTTALQGAPSASSDDLTAVNNWLQACLKVGQTYLLAGTGLTDLSQATTPQAQGKVGQNMETFSPEVGRFIDAELAIEAADASDAAAFIAATPGATSNAQAQQGFDQARGGVTQTAQGILQTLAPQGLPNDWREARARALVAFAPHAAAFISDAQKQQLSQQATQAAQQTDDAQLGALLNQFATAIVAKGT